MCCIYFLDVFYFFVVGAALYRLRMTSQGHDYSSPIDASQQLTSLQIKLQTPPRVLQTCMMPIDREATIIDGTKYIIDAVLNRNGLFLMSRHKSQKLVTKLVDGKTDRTIVKTNLVTKLVDGKTGRAIVQTNPVTKPVDGKTDGRIVNTNLESHNIVILITIL